MVCKVGDCDHVGINLLLCCSSMHGEPHRNRRLHQKVSCLFVFALDCQSDASNAPRPLSFRVWNSAMDLDPAEEYKMDHKRRGLALIFNQERFFWRLGLNDRHGTNADRYNLEKRPVGAD